MEVAAADLDGDLDSAVGGKRGPFLFENLTKAFRRNFTREEHTKAPKPLDPISPAPARFSLRRVHWLTPQSDAMMNPATASTLIVRITFSVNVILRGADSWRCQPQSCIFGGGY